MPNTDGCISRQKTASGAMVYLTEELGDARLRCVQLKKYLDEAVKLIEQSPHKDHFYEVAGHLIEGVPTAAFKLEKALDAVALAANHLDSEELKNSILPEKQKELERVLKDVRIRHPVRRSEAPMTPKVTAERLRTLASQAHTTGQVPIAALASLIGELESGLKKASGEDTISSALEALADAVVTPSTEAPSRAQLAASLRNVLAACMDLARFEEGKPADPTEDMSPEDAAEWKKNTEKHKDKFKSADWKTSEARNWKASDEHLSRHEEGKPVDPTKDMSPEDAKKWKKNTEEHKDDFKAAAEEKDSRFEEGKPADPTENMSPEDAKRWKTEHAKNKDNFKAA